MDWLSGSSIGYKREDIHFRKINKSNLNPEYNIVSKLEVFSSSIYLSKVSVEWKKNLTWQKSNLSTLLYFRGASSYFWHRGEINSCFGFQSSFKVFKNGLKARGKGQVMFFRTSRNHRKLFFQNSSCRFIQRLRACHPFTAVVLYPC